MIYSDPKTAAAPQPQAQSESRNHNHNRSDKVTMSGTTNGTPDYDCSCECEYEYAYEACMAIYPVLSLPKIPNLRRSPSLARHAETYCTYTEVFYLSPAREEREKY